MHAIGTLVKYTTDELTGHEETKQPQDNVSWLPQYKPKYAPLTRDIWRTEHDDHWAYVAPPETAVPKESHKIPEQQPLAKNGNGGRRNYNYEKADRNDRRMSRSSEKVQYPTDTNDAVVNAINRFPTSPYVQNQVIPPPAQKVHWIPTSRDHLPSYVPNEKVVFPFKSTLPYSLEQEGVGIKIILGEKKWRKLKREVESIGGYNEQLDCCYTHAFGRCAMYLCFPCFYCCLYKHNEEYTTNVYKHWRDEFEAKKIDFSIYYSPGSLWDAFMEDDFQLAPSTHCFCIDTSSSYVRGVYQTHADVNSGTNTYNNSGWYQISNELELP